MKLSVRSALLAAAVMGALAAPAFAQETVRANGRYCLEVHDSSGIHPLLCRFTTYEQCLQSKTSQGDGCMFNPYIAFQQRR